MSHRKLTQLLQPGFQLYFICMIAFVVVTSFYSKPLAALEGACVAVLALYSYRSLNRRKKEVTKYIENVTGNIDVAAKDTMVNAPLPMVIFRPESGDIIWSNELYLQLMGDREHIFDAKISNVIPEFDTRWLMEGKSECPAEVCLGDRRFFVFGHLVRTGTKGIGGFLATTYWVEVTELSHIRDRYQRSRPVAAVLLLDNYDDLMKNLSDNERSALTSEIDHRLDHWVAGSGAILRRYQRERYIMVFEEQHLQQFVEKKFDILDTLHEVRNPTGINASLSIGIGKDGESFQELMQFANLAIEMALSRGGDQAVIRNKFTFEFFGGRSSEMEKRTKVKSRVMANALNALLSDASQVFVMGHKFPDMDATGAAAGICVAARKKGVPAYIIKENTNHPSRAMIDKLVQQPEYHSNFIAPADAEERLDDRSLVVVVDTNRPEQVQAPELLKCKRVAVIDHHRRAATYIEGAALNYHEPYASSASELVSELLQYIVEPADLMKVEAEALLAGIVLDTKNFTMRTGGRTFEAAAFLRRSGADTSDVKKLFQNNLAETVAKYNIIQAAKLYHQHIAVAVVPQNVGRVTAAQAADELLNIIGIHTSFVLFQDNERVIVSARSNGETNVQVILEKLGGGGNAAVAGAQIADKKLEEVAAELVRNIDQYMKE